ncbi:SDR family NAD(P)-dependent oxidoreductase [Marmoricola endophyticus]|nr:SDR family oxidoreductase [Marmoricola endophyticus]
MTTTDTLQSPVALVTGGSRGLGRATVLALAGAGVDVLLTYRSGEAEAAEVVAAVEAAGARAHALHLDTTDLGSFADFASQVREVAPDGLDILVNNAGTGLYSMLQETTEEEFDQVFAVHVKGPFFLTQALEPLLADGAHIVNISSGLTRLTLARSGAYAAAKGAVEVLTRYQSVEYGARGITANTVAVGPVPTDFGGGHLRSNPELLKVMAERTALGRVATPEDVGQAIAGLTTASGTWITGQRIEASGGL